MRLTKEKQIEKEQLFKQGLKQCPQCPEPKLLSEFGKDKKTKDGLQTYCKEHIKEDRDKPENKEKRAKTPKNIMLNQKTRQNEKNLGINPKTKQQ